MSSPNTTIARFSTGVANIRDAPNFPWEYPVPVNDFWNALKFTSGRNFLTCFSQDEIDAMQLEQHGSLSLEEKSHLLIKILEDKISSSESHSQPLWSTNHALWEKLMMAQATIYSEIDLLDHEIQITQTMLDHRIDKSNLSQHHNLAYLFLQKGDYAKAEEFEKPCTEVMDAKLGKDSPQSNSSRRIRAKAIWMQGRQEEAEEIIRELFNAIEASGEGKYAIYQEIERKMAQEMVEDLKKWRPGT